MSDRGKFGTVINCMDGRVQLQVIEWIKKEYGVDFVDSITVPGPDLVLAMSEKQSIPIKERVDISVNAHGSRVVAICGHDDCAGNPVSEEEHKKHVEQAVERIKSWDYPVEVAGLWVGSSWEVEKVI